MGATGGASHAKKPRKFNQACTIWAHLRHRLSGSQGSSRGCSSHTRESASALFHRSLNSDLGRRYLGSTRSCRELLWIGLLNAEHGIETGAHICAEVTKAAKPELEVLDQNPFLCLASSFELFGQDHLVRIRRRLESVRVLSDLQVAVSPFVRSLSKVPIRRSRAWDRRPGTIDGPDPQSTLFVA